jgi:hypothetical protein
MMRYFLILALIIYAYLAFVMPMNWIEAKKEGAATTTNTPNVHTDPSAMVTFIMKIALKGDPAPCANLGLVPKGEKTPTHGQWIAYCVGVTMKDEGRCDALQTDGLNPDLRALCTKALSVDS